MHVGLNLIYLVPGQTGGMEVYAREIAPRLAAMPDLRVSAFVNREAAGEDFGCEQVVVDVNATNRLQWVRGEQMLLPGLAEKHGCDLVHSLGSTAPVRGDFRRVVTIHDLHYKVVPDAHFGLRGLGMRALIPAAARSAHRIIVDAASTREDLHEYLGTPREKVDVVPLAGASPPDVMPTTEAELRRRFELGDRQVLLSVSAKRPHKNLRRLIDAVASLPAPRPVLVLPGYPTPHEAELRARAAALGIAGDVRFPAWVSAADLEALYAVADAFVFPSLYEGFGLPIVEAQDRGVPVACSNRGAVAEVAGEGAVLFDPESVSAIARAIDAARCSADFAPKPTHGATAECQHGWENTARSTHRAYLRSLSRSRPRSSL